VIPIEAESAACRKIAFVQIEQDYTLDGESQLISAPTTIVFRRDAGGWKAALFHSIPLPEQT
jgi:ketosteroid isomerase-like protein